jgi:DNA-binding response OmpR family regulator
VKILIADDDADMLDMTTYSLHKNGYEVITVTDGVQALERWGDDRPDLVLLDVGLPRVNGFDVCRRIRERDRTPVIMVTGRGEEEQVVQGFVAGADDYVRKPFSHRELAMRIRAVLARCSGQDAAQPLGRISTPHMRLDLQSHEVTRGDVSARLTPLEFRLLYILASNEGRVVSTSRLIQHAWGCDGVQTALLKTHVCHIRRKLRMQSGQPGNIKAVPWVGYYLTRD